jgi:hypothetical protein
MTQDPKPIAAGKMVTFTDGSSAFDGRVWIEGKGWQYVQSAQAFPCEHGMHPEDCGECHSYSDPADNDAAQSIPAEQPELIDSNEMVTKCNRLEQPERGTEEFTDEDMDRVEKETSHFLREGLIQTIAALQNQLKAAVPVSRPSPEIKLLRKYRAACVCNNRAIWAKCDYCEEFDRIEGKG